MKRVSVAEKVIAITGGARGIGLATATVLHGLGAVVAIGDIDRSAVKEAGSTLGLKVAQRVLEVNIYGVILGTKLAAKRMLPRGHGHIINIASVGSVQPVEGIATYCATKHAVLGYTDTVRMENRGSGVHFSAVLPILVNTDMISGAGHVKGFKNVEPDDVARTVAAVIAKPKPRVFLPRSFGVVLTTQRFLPQRVSEAMARAMGNGRV